MRKAIVFLSVFLLFASLAAADTLSVTGLPPYVYNSVYVGGAVATLNGGQSFTIVCNDYVDTTYIPSSFSVNVSTIPTLQFAMYAQPGPPTAGQLANYQMASMLLWQMDQPGNQSSSGIGDLNFAIWNVFNPAGVPDTAGSNAWVTWAQGQNPANWDYSGVRVYTPLVGDNNGHGGVNQEFMGGSASPVPEPTTGTLAGIGGGLLAFGLIGRRRLKKE